MDIWHTRRPPQLAAPAVRSQRASPPALLSATVAACAAARWRTSASSAHTRTWRINEWASNAHKEDELNSRAFVVGGTRWCAAQRGAAKC